MNLRCACHRFIDTWNIHVHECLHGDHGVSTARCQQEKACMGNQYPNNVWYGVNNHSSTELLWIPLVIQSQSYLVQVRGQWGIKSWEWESLCAFSTPETEFRWFFA
jgi:hypothetical protein